jgi:DNA-binding transcriptional regulator WhiA
MRNKILNRNKDLKAYIVGLAIGDGNLSNPSGRATRLRITCDKKYPLLIERIKNSLGLLLPENKVSIVMRDKNYLDISVHSNYLENLLGWRANMGSKFIQNVSIPEWIKTSDSFKINCLRGLIETDGSIYNDRGYKMMMFVTIIPKLAIEVAEMIASLGFFPHLYAINDKKEKYNKKTLYHVRLSKNVEKFLDIVKPEKE